MTPKQLQLIHTAKRQLQMDDARYRMLLWNMGGVQSSKDLDNTSFEDVMAVMEAMGFSQRREGQIDRASFTGGGGSIRPPCTYWQDKVGRRGKFANERMVHKIRELAGQQRYELAAMVLRMSEKRTDRVEQLTPHEAWNLIEALKKIIDREGRQEPTPPSPWQPPPRSPPAAVSAARSYDPDFEPVTDDEIPF